MTLYDTILSSSGFIFDFDGTLLDSEKDWHLMYEETLSAIPDEAIARLCTERVPSEIFPGDEDFEPLRDSHGFPYITMGQMARFAAPFCKRQPEEIMGLWSDAICGIYDSCPVVPGASELLGLLTGAGLPVAVATMSLHEPCNRWLTKQSVNIPVITAETEGVNRAKPDPRVFQVAAASLNLDPHSCVVFEDTVQGATGARRAGCYVVGITHCLTPGAAERLAEVADITIPDYTGLVQELQSRLRSGTYTAPVQRCDCAEALSL